MKTRKFWVLPTAVFSLAIFVSCQSNDMDQLTNASDASVTILNTVSNDAQAASISQEVISSVAEYTPNFDSGSYGAVGMQKVSVKNSVTITLDDPESNTFPKVVTIDFGTSGFVGRRLNVLKGKIIVTIQARNSRTYTYDNFTINENQLKGYKSEIFNGVDTWYYSEKDTIVRVDGKKIIRNSERTHVLIDFNQTPFVYSDDTYSITGTVNGMNENGRFYTMSANESEPLISYTGYNYFIKGKLTLSSEGKTAVVDYGDGTHDSLATVTMDGETKEINLNK